MTDQIVDIVVPILRSLQADTATLKADMAVIKEAVRRIDARFASVDSMVGGIYSTTRWQSAELDDHRGRLEALEDLNKPTPPEKNP